MTKVIEVHKAEVNTKREPPLFLSKIRAAQSVAFPLSDQFAESNRLE